MTITIVSIVTVFFLTALAKWGSMNTDSTRQEYKNNNYAIDRIAENTDYYYVATRGTVYEHPSEHHYFVSNIIYGKSVGDYDANELEEVFEDRLRVQYPDLAKEMHGWTFRTGIIGGFDKKTKASMNKQENIYYDEDQGYETHTVNLR